MQGGDSIKKRGSERVAKKVWWQQQLALNLKHKTLTFHFFSKEVNCLVKKNLFLLLQHRMYNESSDVIKSADVCIYLEIRTLKWSLSTACYQIIIISENRMEINYLLLQAIIQFKHIRNYNKHLTAIFC